MPCRPSASIRKNPTPCRFKAIVTNQTEVLVPDIGGFKDVSVIDVLVKDGQQIEKETPLITIETEKAAMDVPAPVAGRIAQVKLKQGDKVSEGSLILLLEPSAAPAAPAAAATSAERGNSPATAGADAASSTASTSRAAPAPAQAAATPPAPPVSDAATRTTTTSTAAAAAAPTAAAIDEAAFSKAYASPSV